MHESTPDSPTVTADSRAPGVVVAIDGPAGAGKSTVASYLAKTFGLLNLETGAMYRALALKALKAHMNLDDADAMAAMAQSTIMELIPGDDRNQVSLDGTDVTAELRAPEVTAGASRVSVHPAVRAWMVNAQRAMGRRAPGGVVMEGRDIGTVVFPDATVKLFLDASLEARGDRRYQQQGADVGESKAAITREMADRDGRDRHRDTSPLVAAPDAVLIETTTMSLLEVLDRAADLVRSAIVTQR